MKIDELQEARPSIASILFPRVRAPYYSARLLLFISNPPPTSFDNVFAAVVNCEHKSEHAREKLRSFIKDWPTSDRSVWKNMNPVERQGRIRG